MPFNNTSKSSSIIEFELHTSITSLCNSQSPPPPWSQSHCSGVGGFTTIDISISLQMFPSQKSCFFINLLFDLRELFSFSKSYFILNSFSLL